PPGRPSGPPPAVVLCHGFPSTRSAASAAAPIPELADRIAPELPWAALALPSPGRRPSPPPPRPRGRPGATRHAAAHPCRAVQPLDRAVQPLGIWLVGFGTGGALAICAAAGAPRIRGVAALGAPGDFDDWASHPRRLLQHGRDIGVITDPAFPPSFDAWAQELKDIRAVACVAEYAPRPLLVMHGSDDEVVPSFDARILADAHGSAELRCIHGAGHALRHDPRTIAVLLGWLDRQRHALQR